MEKWEKHCALKIYARHTWQIKRQNNVLKNVNFTIMEGEMVAVMGPSGSGKSTLLYSVSGMDALPLGKCGWEGNGLRI